MKLVFRRAPCFFPTDEQRLPTLRRALLDWKNLFVHVEEVRRT